jgi:hypothetical protein
MPYGSHVTDWVAWHEAYDDPDSGLTRRLRAVRRRIRDALFLLPPGPIRVISMCAGDGRDLIGALAGHPRSTDVSARLVEADPLLVATARRSAPRGVEVVRRDAALSSAYAGLVPADLVLTCGVFGNLAPSDIHRTVINLPRFCQTGATVIWTHHIDPPDRTPEIRDWFGANGFSEVGFDSEPGYHYGVGTHTLTGRRLPLDPDLKLFEFLR